jgi:hypothetical protein
MLTINLNLPTLPTQDQKDAMDGANTPDSTNVFITANDLTIPTLQEVSDSGNTTTNDIQFDSGAGILLDNTSRLREGTIDAGFGGTKGIAQICAVGYELKWEAGRLYVMDGNGLLIRHSLYNFTTIPSANDDSTKGYYVGSLWTLDNGVSYICTDSTSTAATWDIYQDYSLLVPYTGATADVELGAYDLYANKVWLLDASNNAYGSIHLTDNDFHIEDSDGHKMLVIEDGFMQIHLSDTIQSNLFTSGLTDIRDHYLPDASGTIALTSDIVAQVNSDWNAVSGVAQILNKPTIPAAQVNSDWNAVSGLAQILNKPTISGSNTGDETTATIKTKLGITTLSGSNTGDQDLSGLAPLASPTFTGTVTSPAIILSSETASTIASFDASKNVKSLSTATYPSLTELSYVKGVTSAIQTQFDNVGEFIQLGGTTFAPADSTTYFFALNNQLAPATTTGSREFSFIKTGTVTRFIFTVAMTISGTSENVAVYLRNITTATDNSIGNITMNAGANGTGVFNFTPSIAIANTTDRYTIKFVCPAWVTNPTGVYSNVRLFNKY